MNSLCVLVIFAVACSESFGFDGTSSAYNPYQHWLQQMQSFTAATKQFQQQAGQNGYGTWISPNGVSGPGSSGFTCNEYGCFTGKPGNPVRRFSNGAIATGPNVFQDEYGGTYSLAPGYANPWRRSQRRRRDSSSGDPASVGIGSGPNGLFGSFTDANGVVHNFNNGAGAGLDRVGCNEFGCWAGPSAGANRPLRTFDNGQPLFGPWNGLGPIPWNQHAHNQWDQASHHFAAPQQAWNRGNGYGPNWFSPVGSGAFMPGAFPTIADVPRNNFNYGPGFGPRQGDFMNPNGGFINGHAFGNWFTPTHIEGNGKVETEERSVGPFTGVSIGGNVILQVTQATPTGTVRLEGESNVLPDFEVWVLPNGILEIWPKPNVNFGNRLPVKAFVSSDTINLLNAMGDSQILVAALNSSTVSASIMGSSKLEITSGRVDTFIVQALGQSQVSTFGLDAGQVDAQAMGSSVIQLTASKTLKASAMGSSQISYRGSPQLGPIVQFGGSTVSAST